MHNGLTVTPTWFYILINESSNWTPANDPCIIEFGVNWRIPLEYEWNDIRYYGGWNNWNGPWESDLKLHAAGFINELDGTLQNRGSYGYYWSNAQSGGTVAIFLWFHSGDCIMNVDSKGFGMPLRCVRE
jgi:hypothetical protein